jgi:hypothetical protein
LSIRIRQFHLPSTSCRESAHSVGGRHTVAHKLVGHLQPRRRRGFKQSRAGLTAAAIWSGLNRIARRRLTGLCLMGAVVLLGRGEGANVRC